MVFAVIRHAESIENADKYRGFYQDRRPYSGQAAHEISRRTVGLTPSGFRQALWLGEQLAELVETGGRVFTSTYRRSMDTAAVAFPALDADRLHVTGLLDEQHYGDATYMTKQELFATYPDGADTRRNAKHLWVPPGGGESLAGGVLDRAQQFVALAQAVLEEGRPVVAVSHHTTILALRALLEERGLVDVVEEARRAKTPNAGVLRYAWTGTRFTALDCHAPPAR